jgi:hypothetical protein
MTSATPTLRPICYMIMPFRKKKVDEPRPPGAPAEIDFDALWERAYWPAIDAMGYVPMRADFDPNSAIVKAMLERIAFADLVIADVTTGNGNCYYELGVRHVAKKTDCVLVAADWVRPLFDIAQFASVRFPLTDGSIPQAEADVIKQTLIDNVRNVKDADNPYYALLGDAVNEQGRRSAFRDFAERLSAFQAKVKAIRNRPADARAAAATALVAELETPVFEIPEIAIELVSMMRDYVGWRETITFIEALPQNVRRLAWVAEQHCLAVAKAGDPAHAIGLLEELIAKSGETPERRGLIGGRYKQLWSDARAERRKTNAQTPSQEENEQLTKAIAEYMRGMMLDLNEYYCANNLPSLLIERGDPGDVERAGIIEHFVVEACERARALGAADEWLRPTLLGAAFRSGDVAVADRLARDVTREGHSVWKLDSTLKDLKRAVESATPEDKRGQLQAIYDRLAALVPTPKSPA